jgi:heterodisulfide reductase subunit A
VNVGSIVVATGFDFYDPSEASEYGYKRFHNVVSSLELERLLSASGPTRGFLQRFTDGETPRRIAFVQCVGSRCVKRDILYCSRICCMNAVKDALLIEELFPDAELLIFNIDVRAFGKGFEEFYRRSQGNARLRYVKGKPSKVTEDTETEGLLLHYEDMSTGSVEHTHVDMVVLSSALVPSEGTNGLADVLGVDVAADGYIASRDAAVYPLETTREGIYLAGCASGPKDITDAVAEASGAAALAASHVLKDKLEVVKEEIEQRDVSGAPRIGVFVCHCGINIGGVLDVSKLTEYARGLPDVAFAEHLLFACAESTQRQIQDRIAEHDLNRAVVAACTPRTHEPVFRRAAASVGLNPYLVEMVNIRDQCSWVHHDAPVAATEKARDLIRMAVSRARLLQPLSEKELDVGHEVLVVGGGIAGIETAIDLSRRGFKVHLIEKSSELGGRTAGLASTYPTGRSGKSIIDEKLADLRTRDIDVRTETELSDVSGFVGNFEATVTAAGGGEETLNVGAIVLAIGADLYEPEGDFGYGTVPNVIGSPDFERVLGSKGKPRFRKKPVETVVFVQCVGSRGPKGNPECSRYCCQSAIRQAIQLREKGVNVVVLHRDVRVYGRGAEEMYRRARGMGVTFLRYDPDDPPSVEREGERAVVTVRVPTLELDVRVPADVVVLSLGMVPKKAETTALREMLKVPVGADGFLLERHPKFGPVETNIEGVFLTGCAQSPKDIGDSVAQASAVASKVGALLSRDTITLEPVTSVVAERLCRSCGQCVEVCEFNAISIETLPDGRRVASVNEALCKGCGTCAVVCPSGAISIRHFTDQMIETMVEAYLEPSERQGPATWPEEQRGARE